MHSSTYRVRVAGTAGPAARVAFAGLRVEVLPPWTAVTGTLDQRSLHRLLDRIQALGLELVDVHPIDEDPVPERAVGGTCNIGSGTLFYRITVSGHLSRPLQAVFEDLVVRDGSGVTELTGRLDQAALFGVLHRVRVRCLSLVDVSQVASNTRTDSHSTDETHAH